MKKYNQQGGAALVVSVVLLVIALVGAVAFGSWAYSSRQDFKNNSDQKALAAVTKAQASQKVELQKQFDEQEKKPNKTFKGPITYGTITFDYPKTWSAYVDQANSTEPLNGYFYPDVVPSVSNSNSPNAFALRLELVNDDYATVIKNISASAQQNPLTAIAYVPPKMVGVANVQTGTKFDGQIEQKVQGSLVVIKVRDKTLKIYTESGNFLNDFNNTILASLTFVP